MRVVARCRFCAGGLGGVCRSANHQWENMHILSGRMRRRNPGSMGACLRVTGPNRLSACKTFTHDIYA